MINTPTNIKDSECNKQKYLHPAYASKDPNRKNEKYCGSEHKQIVEKVLVPHFLSYVIEEYFHIKVLRPVRGNKFQ